MKNCYKYENDKVRFLFEFSENEARILAAIMRENIQSDPYLWRQRLAYGILNAVNDGFKKYQNEIHERNMRVFNEEYECNWIK